MDHAGKTWDDVPPEIKATFEKIMGIGLTPQEIQALIQKVMTTEEIQKLAAQAMGAHLIQPDVKATKTQEIQGLLDQKTFKPEELQLLAVKALSPQDIQKLAMKAMTDQDIEALDACFDYKKIKDFFDDLKKANVVETPIFIAGNYEPFYGNILDTIRIKLFLKQPNILVEAIDEHSRGSNPIESFLAEYIDEQAAKPGDQKKATATAESPRGASKTTFSWGTPPTPPSKSSYSAAGAGPSGDDNPSINSDSKADPKKPTTPPSLNL